MRRILAGVPLYGVDIRERDLPQETEQMRALNFNKGCYVGQEIVERIRSRGSVHRKFTGYASRSGGQIAPGAKVLIGEKEVGEVTSATFLNTSQNAAQSNGKSQSTVALGYIRREHAASRNEVTIAGAKAWVVELPLREAAAPDSEKPAGAKVSTSSAN
jgi:folate-binding protein YgfZ